MSATTILARVTDSIMRAFQQFYPMVEYVDPIGSVERIAADLATARSEVERPRPSEYPAAKKSVEEIFADITLNRDRILDEFCKAYLAEDLSVRDAVLIEDRSIADRVSWHFERRPNSSEVAP